MPAQRTRSVRLAAVDLQSDSTPAAHKHYSLITASSASLAALPVPSTPLKHLSLELQNLYVEDLPEFRNRTEGILTLTCHTRTIENTNNKEELRNALQFRVKSRNYAPGFLQRAAFRHILLSEYFDLGLDLVEIDKSFATAYVKVEKVVSDSGLLTIDALNSIPYLKVASRLFSGLIQAFGRNPDDQVWKEVPGLHVSPGPGGAFLRTAIYVLYERRSIFNTRHGRKRSGKAMPLADLVYRNGELHHKSDPAWPLANHLVFGITLRSYAL